jgi:hypothetical protein
VRLETTLKVSTDTVLKNEHSSFFKSVAIYFPVVVVKDHAHNTIQIHSFQENIYIEYSSFCMQL